MQTRKQNIFTTIQVEGAILPPDLLQRIIKAKDVDGLNSESFHLLPNEKINEAINRSWNRLKAAWQIFTRQRESLAESDIGTTLTRERWLLQIFNELGYGRLSPSKRFEIENKEYSISHTWQNTPIHLLSFKIDLDKRKPGISGASKSSPHSLVQEFLNRSEKHLWGFLSNGLKLRILRDNVSLTRQAYVEFDLQAMMEGEVYSDFVLLWILCHQSRVEAEKPEECWLEQWSKSAQVQGTRALDELRKGVEETIALLGKGFLSYPNNRDLKEKLRSGALDKQDYYRQLLRLVYRLIFLFAAEDRDLLLNPKASPDIKNIYNRYYSTQRIRRLADQQRGTRNIDLFRGLRLVMKKQSDPDGCPELGLPALGSFLFSDATIPDLDTCDIRNHDFLDAIRALAFITDGQTLRPVDFKNTGSEELGSIYESLLELHPELNIEGGSFELKTASGHERKTTGSYYTPTNLIQVLLDSALDPVVAEAMKSADPEKAILNLKVCDPACGSGHFLIAAAHRMSRKLASVRTGDEEAAPEEMRKALRDIIGHCIYGVDINEMSVELCKVGLWMEALEPGKPLSFLDHRILCGNSLLGTTPALISKGIPDDAFKAIEGDDKAYCTEYRKRNKQEREQGQKSLFHEPGLWFRYGNLSDTVHDIDILPDDNYAAVARKEYMFDEHRRSDDYLLNKLIADAWCAAFVWKKTNEFEYPITQEVFRRIQERPAAIPQWLEQEINCLAEQYNFFQWHIEFPDVFQLPAKDEKPENKVTGWSGGFDVVLGNPPYGKYDNQKIKTVIHSINSISQETSNYAADFIILSNKLSNLKANIGLVVPKSFTYSFAWKKLREKFQINVLQIIDVSKAWKDVLLEQILITISQKEQTKILLGNLREGILNIIDDIDYGLIRDLEIFPTGLNSDDLRILKYVIKTCSNRFSELISTKRGFTGYQKYLNKFEGIPVVRGRDIKEFSKITPTHFVEKKYLKPGHQVVERETILFQNIVAHLTKPKEHIKLIGTITSEPILCLDTVNIMVPLKTNLSSFQIAAFLMSNFVNWYVHTSIYNKAIRTMHFDNYFIEKIRIPSLFLPKELNEIGIKLFLNNDKSYWEKLNNAIYDYFSISNEMRHYINQTQSTRNK